MKPDNPDALLNGVVDDAFFHVYMHTVGSGFPRRVDHGRAADESPDAVFDEPRDPGTDFIKAVHGFDEQRRLEKIPHLHGIVDERLEPHDGDRRGIFQSRGDGVDKIEIRIPDFEDMRLDAAFEQACRPPVAHDDLGAVFFDGGVRQADGVVHDGFVDEKLLSRPREDLEDGLDDGLAWRKKQDVFFGDIHDRLRWRRRAPECLMTHVVKHPLVSKRNVYGKPRTPQWFEKRIG